MVKIKKILIVFIFIMMLTSFFSIANVYASLTVDDIFAKGDEFLQRGEEENKNSSAGIKEDVLKSNQKWMYNLFFGFGLTIAVGVGIVLGIQYVMGSVEKKADLKQALIGYLFACLILFGAFGIWKIVVNILIDI